MKFNVARTVEDIVWTSKLADLPRANNRAAIDALFNGMPPFSLTEQKENNIAVNVNFLESNNLSRDARTQYENAFLGTEQYFRVRLDRGPRHKRTEWSEIITNELRKVMKQGASAMKYRENLRSVFASDVLHGIGPSVWSDDEKWAPTMQAMGDVMIPSQTLLTMENLPHFAVYRRYTPYNLWKMTHKPQVDPGWNMPMVEKAIDWARRQYGQTRGGNDYIYSPERIQEDFKEDAGLWASDIVPTINCWDFYFLDDADGKEGWKRRVVFDTPSISETAQTLVDNKVSSQTMSQVGTRGDFLYTSGNKNFADKLSSIIHFQFADGSIVSPFRYHSVRSLGFLLYSVCFIQNRLRCAFTEAAFEACLQYLRVNNPADAERALKINLVNRGLIPEGVQFIPPNERWQVNANLITEVLNLNKASISDNSTSYTKDTGFEQDQREKTATQITAEMNASSAMVGAMLQASYGYQVFQYIEIGRRFCRPNSSDPDVRRFRVNVLKQGIPEYALDVDAWDISVEQIMGNGNRQLAIGQASMLMQNIDRYEPDSQRIILRDYTFAVTGNPSKTTELVPAQQNAVTNSIHDAQISAAALLSGLPMGLKQGVNHSEYAGALLQSLSVQIGIAHSQGMPTQQQLGGMYNLAGIDVQGQPIQGNGAAAHIQIVEQQGEKEIAKQLSDALGKLLNELKGFSQRLQQQAQAGNGQQNGVDPETQGKVQGQIILAQTKAQISKAHSDQKLKQSEEKHRQAMANRLQDVEVNTAATDVKTAAEIRREGLKNSQEEKAVST